MQTGRETELQARDSWTQFHRFWRGALLAAGLGLARNLQLPKPGEHHKLGVRQARVTLHLQHHKIPLIAGRLAWLWCNSIMLQKGPTGGRRRCQPRLLGQHHAAEPPGEERVLPLLGKSLVGCHTSAGGQKAFLILVLTSASESSMKMADAGSLFDIFSWPWCRTMCCSVACQSKCAGLLLWRLIAATSAGASCSLRVALQSGGVKSPQHACFRRAAGLVATGGVHDGASEKQAGSVLSPEHLCFL